MQKNLIIGKDSFVTKHNLKFIKNSIAISAKELDKKKLHKLTKSLKKVNIIFNNFYPSKFLNDLNYMKYKKLCDLSLEKIFVTLESIPSKKINKIIYTSSSAVYGLSENLNNPKKDQYNRELYSSFKLTAEKIIMNYANKKNKNFYVMRLFNTYGNKEDSFSFIEKILRAKRENTKITLINDGLSLRDFIHLDDIAKIYNIFLKKQFKKGIYDLGSGKGFLIKDLVRVSKISEKKIIRINKIEEIKNSIANTKNLFAQIGKFDFKNLNDYIKNQLNLKRQPNTKFFKHISQNTLGTEGIVIYGAGNAGIQVFHELNKKNENVLCFVDDNVQLQNSILHGRPVLSFENILKLKVYSKIKTIYLTIPSLNKNKQTFMLNKIKKNFFDVRFLPEKKFLLSDQISLNDINIDEINDILNRKQIKIKKIKKLNNKVALVTGAGGTIGSEICRQLIQQKVKKVIAIDKSEIAIYNLKKELGNELVSYKLADINDLNFLEKLIFNKKIEFIFHAAAYKHVNILENNIFSAVKNNIFSTYNICYLAKKYSCEMIFISTDKAANPKSILGYSKRFAEKICEHFNNLKKKDFIKIVRFGNVFGSSGSAITNFLDQINMDKPVKITNMKASRFFMTIMEACHLVLQTTEIKSNKKIFVLNMGKPLNIFNLAKNLGKIKSKINPNYHFKYQVIGLQPGEKLHETIVDKKEVVSKHNDEILLVKNKYNKKNDFIKIYNNLILDYKRQNGKALFNSLSVIRKI